MNCCSVLVWDMERGDDATKRNDLNLWVQQYTSALLVHARQRVRKKDMAEDLVQDTFVAAWQGYESFRAESSVKTWLFGILENKIREYLRVVMRRGEQTEADLVCFSEDGNWLPEWRPQHWSVHVENGIVVDGDQHLLDNPAFLLVFDQCLDELPHTAAGCVCATYQQQRTGKEICQDLQIQPTQYWQLLHRARQQLRRCLDLHWFATHRHEPS